MSKREQLIEYITQDVIEYLIEDNGVDIKNAMSLFFNSEIFNKLNDLGTGLYLCSSPYVYDLFSDEIQHGGIIQNEI